MEYNDWRQVQALPRSQRKPVIARSTREGSPGRAEHIPASSAAVAQLSAAGTVCCACPGTLVDLEQPSQHPQFRSRMLVRPSCVGVGLRRPLASRPPAPVARLCRRGGRRAGLHCTAAAPDGGSTPQPYSRLSPNSEEIKQAILGYTSAAAADSGAAHSSSSSGHAALAAAPHGAAVGDRQVQQGSWEDWKLHLEELDEMLQDLQTLDSELGDAVAAEDYRRAAELKAALADIEEADTVGWVLREMDAALAEERYEDAATLRDAGGVGLMGWWAGKGEGDALGHVIRVTPEFGRYVAQAYTARELAEVGGWSREASLRDLLSLNSQDDGSGSSGPGHQEEPGLPVFELAVRRDPETGELQQQAVALFSPVDLGAPGVLDVLGGGPGGSISEMEIEGVTAGVVKVEKDGDGEVVSVRVEFTEDDSDGDGTFIGGFQVEDFQDSSGYEASSSGSEAGDASDDSPSAKDDSSSATSSPASLISELLNGDDEISIDRLAGLFPSAAREQLELDLRRYSSGGEEYDEGIIEGSMSSGMAGSSGSAGEQDDVQQQISDALQQQEEEDAAEARLRGLLEGGVGGAGSSTGGEEEEDMAAKLERLMARLQGGNFGEGAAALLEEAGEAMDDMRFASVTLQRAPAAVEWHSRDSFTIRASPVPEPELAEAGMQQQQQQQEQQLGGPGAGGNAATVAAAAAEEAGRRGRGRGISLRLADSSEGDEPSAADPPAAPGGSGSSSSEASDPRLARLEEEVQAWARRRGAKREQVEAILKATMAAAIAQGIGAVSESEEEQQSAVGLEGMCTYSRLPTERFVKTDPFSGLYLGAFGPHGPELLQLQRMVIDGEEWVHATKVTGDRNVPAGEVSFRAKVGRQHRLAAAEWYPVELGVKGRFKGQGRVAQEGFQHPKWVEGELLQLSAGNPVTHGAELGFVYNMDGVKRFLILFSRVDLDALPLP